jgi:hypothetical protein
MRQQDETGGRGAPTRAAAARRVMSLLIVGLMGALTACGGGGGGVAAPAEPAAAAAIVNPVPAQPAPDEGIRRSLGTDGELALDGLPAQAAGAPAGDTGSMPPSVPGARVFHIDSARGDDAHDGRASRPEGGARGPWRTLARLAASDLAAGDTVLLACHGVWHETLRLPASGRAGAPIVVRAADEACAERPTIDGSVPLAPESFTRRHGEVRIAALSHPPLQLFHGADALAEAHHPRGDGSSNAGPVAYLPMPADGEQGRSGNRAASHWMRVGPELALPAGADLAAGARVRVRTNAYVIDESAVSAASADRLTLARATSYPLKAGWGYYLVGQPWMVDRAGEWAWDARARELHLWPPEPAGAALRATVLALGIDLDARTHIVIDGLRVRKVGTGIALRRAVAVQLQRSVVEDTADHGIAAAGSSALRIEHNLVQRTGLDAIAGMLPDMADAQDLLARHNLIRASGVLVDGERVLSLPRRSLAAISAGRGSVVSGNTLVDSGYIGILVGPSARVEGNVIYGSCTLQDDCGAIYTGGADNRSRITGNVVLRSRGAPAGKPGGGTQAQGIYVDDLGADVLIEGNTVIDADHGVQLHNTARAMVRGNVLHGNRASQIWLQEDSARVRPEGDMQGNLIEGNQLAPLHPGAVGVLLTTRFASSADFGRFDGNRYFDRVAGSAVLEATSAGARRLTLAQWKAATGIGSRAGVEPAGSAVSAEGRAAYAIAGNNLVPNAALERDSSGWSSWNAQAPAGRLQREPCHGGWCLHYQAGGSPGVLSSPRFALAAGRWYRLTLDIATETDAQPVPLVVRRHGGDFASLADRSLAFTGQRGWQRHKVVFRAEVSAPEARVDIDGIEAGRSVRIAQLELVPIEPDTHSARTFALVNAGSAARSFACPVEGAAAAAFCSSLASLDRGTPATWPLSVPARSALVLYTQPPALRDSDGDGIADAQDGCPGSAAGVAVNAAGCALGQR